MSTAIAGFQWIVDYWYWEVPIVLLIFVIGLGIVIWRDTSRAATAKRLAVLQLAQREPITTEQFVEHSAVRAEIQCLNPYQLLVVRRLADRGAMTAEQLVDDLWNLGFPVDNFRTRNSAGDLTLSDTFWVTVCPASAGDLTFSETGYLKLKQSHCETVEEVLDAINCQTTLLTRDDHGMWNLRNRKAVAVEILHIVG